MRSEYSSIYFKNGIRLHIHERVQEIFTAARQIQLYDNERFGVLIGSKCVDKEHYWIEYATQPLPNDQSTRSSFVMQDPGHQRTIDAEFISSSGQNIYMGTWHTHPQRKPIPSTVDRNDWHRCIKRNVDRQLFFLIIGTERANAYFRGKCNFLTMEYVDD